MKRTLLPIAICAVIGVILGSFTGVAALGTGINGLWVFGPLGALIGWLVGRAWFK